MKIYTTEQMKKAEILSNDMGITYQRLMENAGCAAAAFIRREIESIVGKNFMIFCGNGNNGGDGFVVARKLFEDGANVIVVLAGGTPRSDEAKYMYSCLIAAGVTILDFHEDGAKLEEFLGGADIIIDAVFGTGFEGEFREPYGEIAEMINSAVAVKISLDIASGVNAKTGAAAKGSVKADFTVAFDAQKPGHLLLPGREYCGRTEEVDIGIPYEVLREVQQSCFRVDEEMVFSAIKKRPEYSNKGNYGRLLCITGSENFPGAAAISALGALRMGAGLVTVATTEKVEAMIASRIPEATFLPLPENEEGGISAEATERLLPALKRANAVLIGCGMGNRTDTAEITEFVLREAKCPVILDADALNSISSKPEVLLLAEKPPVITPHIGEMSRLCKKSVNGILEDRVGTALETAKRYNAAVVLKDASTVIASPGGDVFFNVNGNAGLAKGGSGDLLSGIIAALLAEGSIEIAAAVCGVYLHGAAADLAAKELSEYSMLITDVPKYLGKLLAEKGL